MNSKPHENLELRAEYREEYGDRCELTEYLSGPDWEKVRRAHGWLWNKRMEIHHIYHAATGAGRYDYWPNLISVCRAAHAFCHRGPEGTIACWYAKMMKGRKSPPIDDEHHEFDPESMRDWMCCPLGWIEKYIEHDSVSEHYARMGREILG